MSELEEKVKTWINEQGYPLEMRVAKEFRKNGFIARQSEYFIDHESGDSREIDVIASRQRKIGEILVRVTVCIECKVAKKHPWIIFCSQDTRIAKPAAVVQRPATMLGNEFLDRIAENKYAHNTPFFKLENRNGYSVTEAFTSGKDNAYSSCISVAKCARSLINDADIASKEQGPLCEIIIPTILLQGKLFECHQDNLTLETEEINYATLIWRNQTSNTGHSIITICTETALTKLISNTNRLANFIFDQVDTFSDIEKKVLSQYENRWGKRPTR